MKILVIEDSKISSVIISSVLKKVFDNPSLEFAEDGDIAALMVAKRVYDLILCDYGLPGVQGDEIILKSIEFLQPAKIIAISASQKSNELMEFIGAAGAIQKDRFVNALLNPQKFISLEVEIKDIAGSHE